MKVADCMTKGAVVCRPESTLTDAARMLWDNDCGFLPVVDATQRLVGALTDRDVCMGAFTQGRELASLTVSASMSAPVRTCGADEALESALETMALHQVRRLPVVDAQGRLTGVLSVADVARALDSLTSQDKSQRALADGLVAALSGVCRPRNAPRTERTARTEKQELVPAERKTATAATAERPVPPSPARAVTTDGAQAKEAAKAKPEAAKLAPAKPDAKASAPKAEKKRKH
jgi:CBS domain-containing protein